MKKYINVTRKQNGQLVKVNVEKIIAFQEEKNLSGVFSTIFLDDRSGLAVNELVKDIQKMIEVASKE